MPDQLEAAAAWLGSMQAKYASSDSRTTFYVAGTRRIPIAPTLGESPFETSDADGHYQNFTTQDFIFSAAELTIDGRVFEPTDDHHIEVHVGDVVTLYSLWRPDGKKCFRYSDHHHTRLRVHTKQKTKPRE